MKGFYIFEVESRIGTVVDCLELGGIDNTFTHEFTPGTMTEEVKMHALVSKGTKSKCSKDDTYDFETGALIALMKLCGVEKVVRACNEAFSYETDIKVLRKDNNNLREANKGLQEEVKRLKGESESHWKKYQRNIQKKQDRINQLEAQIKASEDDKLKNIEYYEKEIKNLNYRLTCKDISLEAKDKKISIYEKRILALEAENEKLKLDCEKLQHGYVDSDNVPSGHWDGDILDIVFLPGRACGKQYKALVELFKKIDQKKVDAAYKEAYNTTLPVWQKEVFKQIHKDQLASLLEASKYAMPTEFTFKINQVNSPTKREKMWNDIKNGKIGSIKVEKPFINDFLSEAEENGLVWANGGENPTEWNKWESWRRHDYVVFSLLSVVNPKELTWNTTLKENTVDYLPPMRWDLFKKGRLAVKVNYDNYKEFYEACEREIGKKPMTIYTGEYTVGICKKDGLFEVFTVEHLKNTGKKIVNWEDVR